MTTAAEFIASKPNVLMDFDGPICSVFGGVTADWVAAELRRRLGLTDEHSAGARDPFDILRFAAAEGRRQARDAEFELTQLELEAVAIATPTPGAAELLTALHDGEHAVMVVSNNSAAAVHRYLDVRDKARLVHGVSARTLADPNLLKPDPHLISQALNHVGAEGDQCVLVGDSIADLEAARSAGVPFIAYANKPSKRQAFERRRPHAIIESMSELLI